MLVNELLSRVDRGDDNVNGEKVNLPNQYYLKNYNERYILIDKMMGSQAPPHCLIIFLAAA